VPWTQISLSSKKLCNHNDGNVGRTCDPGGSVVLSDLTNFSEDRKTGVALNRPCPFQAEMGSLTDHVDCCHVAQCVKKA
jgi:hypothetical protein